MIVLRSLSGPMAYLVQVFDLMMILGLVSAHGVDLKSNEKVLHYSHNIRATTAPVGIYCGNNFYCSLQRIQLNETNGYFSSSVSCKETSQHLEVIQ